MYIFCFVNELFFTTVHQLQRYCTSGIFTVVKLLTTVIYCDYRWTYKSVSF